MTGFAAWLARRFGLDPAAFDRWNLLAGRYPDPLLVAAVLAFLAAFVWLSWKASAGVDGRYRRAGLLGLRVMAAAVVALLVFDPSVEFLKTRQKQEALAVVADTSASMSLALRDGRTRSRWVADFLADRAEDMARIEKRFRVGWFAFDSAVRETTGAQVGAVLPRGPRTLIGESLDEVLRRTAAEPPVGVLLFTDGADQGRLQQSLDAAGSLSLVPLYPVLLPEEVPADAAVAEIKTDPYAFIRNALTIRARITLHGIAAKSVNVTLRQDGQVIATQSVAVPAGAQEVEAQFKTTPQRVGRYVYTVEIPRFPEEAVAENNQRHVLVKVVRDRVRVLHVVGEPSWDERFLRRYLEKDPNVDLISFMILRTAEDDNTTPESELSLIPFPTQELFTEELKSFDLVIFQNFDYRPYFHMFPGQLLDNLRRFVEVDGGGFVMIGGDQSFTSGGYAGSPIESILPVHLPGSPAVLAEPFTPALTEFGMRHPVTSLDLPPGEAERAWRSLPPLVGSNAVGAEKARALTLLRHPTARVGSGFMPVLSVMEAGKGRSMMLTSDASWLWNFEAAGGGLSTSFYQRLWNNAIRWLVHDPEFGRVRLESDRDTYGPEEPVRLRCTVLDEEYRPAAKAEPSITVTPRRKGAQPATVAARTAATGVFTADFTPEAGGIYDVQCSARIDGKSAGEDGAVFIVDALGPERRDTAIHNDLLRALAQRSGGRVIEKNDDLVAALKAREAESFEVIGKTVVRLWDNAPLLLLLTVLLSTEWLLRRRWGGI